MREVKFQSVYEQVLRKCALDPADAGFPADRQEFVADLIAQRCKEAWEYDFWPELVTVEARTPVAGLVAYTQTGQTQLGEVLGIWSAHPETSPDTAKSYSVVMTDAGAQIMDGSVSTTVYVKFRRLPPRFTRVAWDPTAGYAEGDIIYYATTGECYQAQTVSAVETWVKIGFPAIFESFVVLAAASDYLRECGQNKKADELEPRARDILEGQHMKTFGQQGQFRGAAVRV
jgi:hypothetical protein